ncbi:MAG: hypothetical protein IPK16_03810 [Anaerolineales bacterium]|nr:hypothetical protein [Anaerolineales bacterium]
MPVIDLMLFYVEQGAICTQTYGDINESFYRSITSVYTDAVRLAATIDDPEIYEPFRPRFVAVFQGFANFGWGVYDYMVDVYYNDFPSEI